MDSDVLKIIDLCIGCTDGVRKMLFDGDLLPRLADALRSELGDGAGMAAVAILFLSLILLIVGRRAVPLVRGALACSFGYFVGRAAAPLLPEPIAQSPIAVGIAMLLICALLRAPIYFLLYTASFGGIGFLTLYSGAAVGDLAGNVYAAAIAAAVLLILSLYSKGYVESLLTSFLASVGVCTALCVLFPDAVGDALIRVAVISLLTVLGFVRCLKMNK